MSCINIPADMNNREQAAKFNADACVSIRDMMILLGATDQQLRDMDERDEILRREPWRKAALRFEEVGRSSDGVRYGFSRGKIDWTGTRFENDHPPKFTVESL